MAFKHVDPSDASDILFWVSTRELIKHVKALRPQDRAKFVDALLDLETKSSSPSRKSARVKWPDIESRAKRILGNKILPNLVILERDDEGH